MVTKGYNSYHGRPAGKTVALIVALSVIILGAVGYLVAQNYLVYDNEGNASIQLPEKVKKEKKNNKTDSAENVPLEIEDPVSALLDVSPIGATELADDALLSGDPAQILEHTTGALVIPVKLVDGLITYNTTAAIPAEVGRLAGESYENLKTILASDRYTVAHICCFCDSYFVRAYPQAACQLETGTYWYDEGGWAWLDPTSSTVQDYITMLCKEMASLGFDEILLDYYSYPLAGRLDTVANLSAEGRVETLRGYAEELRETLPDDMALSVMVRSAVDESFGLDYDMLFTCFDRIYTTTGADVADLQAHMPTGYNDAARLVTVAAKAPETGSYVISK